MDFSQAEKLLGLLSVVVPGVVATMVYDLLVPSERRDWSKHTVGAIAAGGTHGLLFQPVVLWLSRVECSPIRVLGQVLVLIVVPAFMGGFAYWIRKALAARGLGSHPLHTAWDRLLDGTKEAWIRVRTKDGHYVAGRWSANSFAGATASRRDLLLDHATPVLENGQIGTPHSPPSKVWIAESEIVMLEVTPDEEDTSGSEETGRHRKDAPIVGKDPRILRTEVERSTEAGPTATEVANPNKSRAEEEVEDTK